MVVTAILATVLATAIISGVLGMAGGLALMAVLASLLPVSGAMILHGAVQAASNGARFLFLRDRMMWGVLPWYGVGAALSVLVFVSLVVVPDPALVLILVGTPVFSLGGYRLGTVVEVIETGANAVLRVKGGSRVRVIPFADPILGTVLPRQRIEVDWDPEWS